MTDTTVAHHVRTLCVDDKDLVPLTAAEAATAGGGPLIEGMVLA